MGHHVKGWVEFGQRESDVKRKEGKADGNDIKTETGKAQSSIRMAFTTHERGKLVTIL